MGTFRSNIDYAIVISYQPFKFIELSFTSVSYVHQKQTKFYESFDLAY